MDLINLIKDFNIQQIHNSKYKIFDVDLPEYSNKHKNTLFVGLNQNITRIKIKNHKGFCVIIWLKYDFEKGKKHKNIEFYKSTQNNKNIKHFFYNFKSINPLNIDKFINIKKDNSYDNIVYGKLEGGFGNQLFMIFNTISVAKDYNKKYVLNFDKNYVKNYLKEKNVLRKSSDQYNLFKNLNFKDIGDDKLSTFNVFQEKEYKYNKIVLENNQGSYLLKGYYQSYKYFWHNIKEIKKHLSIDYNKIDEINNRFKQFSKPILAMHLRLTDYVGQEDYHPIPPLNYYKKALSYYDLDKYQIVLFSDDIELAKEKTRLLNLDVIYADDLYKNDEEQFYMIMLSDVVVCANSTFSLMACYLNEMYGFNKEAEYIFPHKFFGKCGPSFNIEDYRLNYKFYYINYDNIENIYTPKYDVLTTLHSKDKDRYKKFLNHNKKYLIGSGNFYYVSYNNYDDINAIHVEESKYPFSKFDVIEYIKEYIPDYRWGWYYQQLLKFYCFKINITNSEYILIFDSDILFLNSINLFENMKPLLFKRNTCSKKVHKPYLECQKYIFPELKSDENDSGMCHFMLFNKNLIEKFLNEIEVIHNKPAWKAILDGIINYVKNNKYNESILSEYEMYYNYIKRENLYEYKNDFYYIDIAISMFDINNENNKKYKMIADHHYQSQKHTDDWKKENLIEEQIEKNKLLNNFNLKDITHKFSLYDQINNLFYNYNCNIAEDRIKIIKHNNKINQEIRENNIIIKTESTQNSIKKLRDNFYKNNEYVDYSKYNILCNNKGSLKNHILLLVDNEDIFDEIILNVNYTIISDDFKNYNDIHPLNMFKKRINQIQYIIYKNSKKDKIKGIIEKTDEIKRLDLFLSNKIPLLQICLPSFENIPLRLKKHYESNNDFDIFWNIKLDKNLCETFIKDNYQDNVYFCYSLIYSATSRTDLIRHLFLYKHGGCYFDLSIRIINENFIKLLRYFEFISCRDADYDILQNGILYIKNKKSIICEKFILEILSGVLNYNSNENNKLSFLYNQNVIHDPFFYGPNTLFKVYDEEKNNYKCKLLNTYIDEKVQKSKYNCECVSRSIDKMDRNEYFKVKYIGYNEDLRNFTLNKHYSENWKKGFHFYSPLNYLDKILIINLKHREDRKNEILQELNKLQIEKDKIIFIEAVYIKENGALGCTASHIKCIEYALNNNLENVLILEDDYDFCKDINLFNIELTKFLISNVNWDVLLLHISEYGPPINIKTDFNDVYVNLWSHSAAAYILKKNIFKDLIMNYKKSLNSGKGPLDFHWNNLRLKYNWYANKKIIGYQRESYSDIEKNIANHTIDLNIHFY